MQPIVKQIAGVEEALDLANRAARDVPAYRRLVLARGAADKPLRDLRDLPITSKEYLRRSPLPELLWFGDITATGSWSATSGSTGSPAFFPRDQVALDDATVFYGRILEQNFGIGAESTLVIVCFAMGTWIGGTYTYQTFLALRGKGARVSVTTTGIDVAAALRNLTELGPYYEKVVLAGYPPLIKDLLDQASDDDLAQDIYLLLAGEAIGEGWRDHVLSRIGRPGQPDRVCVMYGTAEAGVMGHETPLTIAVRRAARPGSRLGAAIFGLESTRPPTLVAVDPMRRYVEVEDGYLLFTINSVLPLIRYRINDRGAVFSADRLRDELIECGHSELAAQVDPAAAYVVLSGRTDVATTFYSSNIYPSHLAEAFDATLVTDSVTGRFVVDGMPDESHDPVLRVSVELAAGTDATSSLAQRLRVLCLDSLLAANDEFRALRTEHGERTDPQITLFGYRTGPFAAPQIKHTYVSGGMK
ncbi:MULTISPECIES: phenylacetate--CoA ligase family protein [Gordonia]|uniref:phenylacetate--CoA ligase family protein n=1 Tax=Gordonia TaxID=2053 RepID=UPI0007E9D933|nr:MULTISPECIES: hypothetical protein [Gordonia]OBA33211.1 hypothetical protein A5766_11875 [Gordonia sp. 852002-51296_SCH5728562-b]